MKRFAYLYENGKYIETNVWKERRQKYNNPISFSKREYFSTHKKVENRIPLLFVDGKPNAFFRYFKGGSRVDYTGNGETLTHELCKEVISELKTFNFRCGNDEFIIHVDEVEIEHKIEINGKNYYTDIFVWFSKSSPSYLVSKWNGKLAIEIFVTHETQPEKIKDFSDQGISMIEIKVSDKFRVNESGDISSEKLLNLKNKIAYYYTEKIFGRLLSNPSSEEYKQMVKILKFKEAVVSLKEKNDSLDNQLKMKDSQIREFESQSNMLRSHNRKLQMDLEVLKEENRKLKVSLWKKMLNKLFN